MFRIEMLPAAHGDCLWIEYGTGREIHRILIDGGPAHTYPALRERILHLPIEDRHFDLLVITHIDADHIEGIIRLLQDAEVLGCIFDRIWFNGCDQLNEIPDPDSQDKGVLQGEILGVLIAGYEARTGKTVWNVDLPKRLATVDRLVGTLPRVTLPGDCLLTLLSPDHERLLELKGHWEDELHKAGLNSGDTQALLNKLAASRSLQPLGDVLGSEDEAMAGCYELPADHDQDLAGDFSDSYASGDSEPDAGASPGSDNSLANGSSIAILLQYPKEQPHVNFLLAGDAWPSVIEASLQVLLPRVDDKLSLTGFKIPHHGSIANLSTSLLCKLRCKHYLISTSGAIFRHPHLRAINLLLSEHNGRGKPRIHFNYLTKSTEAWSDLANQESENYVAFHPKGISLEL